MATPPKHALRFLRWFCREDYLEEIEGNLLELYEQQAEISEKAAKRKFFFDVLLHFRPDYIRSFKSPDFIIYPAMLKNYFKASMRNLRKQKFYAAINIGGLTIGLSCFLLIFLFVQHELSYDRFYKNSERIHRVYQRIIDNYHLGTDYFGATPGALASTLMKEVPEVESATAVLEQTFLITKNEQTYLEKGYQSDAFFFKVFPFDFLQGNPETALKDPQGIVLTTSLAKKIFGDANPMGQTLTYQDASPLTVTGLIADPPTNSSLKFSFISSIEANQRFLREIRRDKWYNNFCHTFFSLKRNTNTEAIEPKLVELLQKYSPSPGDEQYFTQPISDLHMTTMNAEIGEKGNLQYVKIFSLAAILVLMLACFNYINLAISRSIKRAQEVGMRKVVGASRSQVMGQFLIESILISFIALLLSIGLVYLLLPQFGELLNRPLEFNILKNRYLLPFLIILTILVGLISGTYPAFVVSSLRPVRVLKGEIKQKILGFSLQRFLILGQYIVSAALIICSLVIYYQFRFIQSRELGYDKDHILTVKLRDNSLSKQFDIVKAKCMKIPQVINMVAVAHLPANISSSTTINDEDDIAENDLPIYETGVGYDYLNVFGIELLSGRFFSPDHPTDMEEAYVLNETAAQALGWTPEEAIGKQIEHEGIENIIGVVKDFHMYSMHLPIKPLMIRLRKEWFSYYAIKVSPENLPKTLTSLESIVEKHSPYPFEYEFLDQGFEALYKEDQRMGKTLLMFTIISILISSMGLFGLAAFTAIQRNKEIGIRRVLGASIKGIAGRLSWDFLKIVSAGFLLAVPLAWYLMRTWLQTFAYHIDLAWWIFAIAGIGSLSLALFTVGYQSLKAALINPIESLKNE